ncbi:DUF1599 domain-containing protein [bacterium D16-51]|nr:DUF1599 domain-containing protein [bacterium D16-59]RKI54205.1 DUF1599 domain-containing protein [bacterium D16-51]
MEQHESLLRQIHDTYVKKNHDYGDSFSRSYEKYGIVAAMVRMEDKWNRLDNLARGGQQMVSGESIRDTLLDLAGYSIMTVMELDRRKLAENQKEFEQQVKEKCDGSGSVQESSAEELVKEEETAGKVVLHDDEKGDIEVNIPEKLEKKPIDEGKVMALYKAKWPQKKIADEMGCSQGRVSQIIRAHKGD